MVRSVEAATPFASLAEELLSSFHDAHPVEALRRGVFRYGGRLPDVSRVGLTHRAEELERFLERLDRITGLSPDDDFARQCQRASCRLELLRLREWNVFARYPLVYLDLLDVSAYRKPWIAPRDDRAMALCNLLTGVPRVLDEARENLSPNLDRTVVRAAARMFEGYRGVLERDLEPLLAEDPGNLPLLQARRQAIAAVDEFLSFLEQRQAEADPSAFPIGPEVFRKMLLYGEGIDVEPGVLLGRGELELERIREELHAAAADFDATASPAEVMRRIRSEHPSVPGAREESRRLVKEHIRRARSPFLRTHAAYSSLEAWAHSCEEMMLEAGNGRADPALEVVRLADTALRTVRLIVSIGMHTRGMTVDEAATMFRREALLDEGTARAEAERGTFDPGYVNYTLGKLMLEKLREDWRAAQGTAFSRKRFHDSFLAWGAAPVPFVRERMLPGDSAAVL